MGFNSAFKGLIDQVARVTSFIFWDCLTLDSTIIRNVGKY